MERFAGHYDPTSARSSTTAADALVVLDDPAALRERAASSTR